MADVTLTKQKQKEEPPLRQHEACSTDVAQTVVSRAPLMWGSGNQVPSFPDYCNQEVALQGRTGPLYFRELSQKTSVTPTLFTLC